MNRSVLGQSWFVIAFCALLLVTLCLTAHSPIYIDEVAYKILYTRTFLDDHVMIGLYPQCNDEWALRVPAWVFPFRAWDAFALADFSNPFFHRIFGVLQFVLEIILSFFLLSQISYLSKRPRSECLVLAASIFTLGVLPFQMVFVRPELSLLLSLTGILWIALRSHRDGATGSRFQRTALFVLMLFLIWAFFSYHVKSVFFLPFFLWLIWSQPLSILARSLGLVWVLFLGLQVPGYYGAFSKCEGYPYLTYISSYLMISPEAVLGDPYGSVLLGFKNLSQIYLYFKQMIFRGQYDSLWLPLQWHEMGKVSWVLLGALFSFTGLLMLSSGVSFFLRRPKLEAYPFKLGMGLLLSLLLLSFFQTAKSFYEPSFFVPIFIFSGMLMMSCQEPGVGGRIKRNFISLLVGVSVLSQLYLAILVFPELERWTVPGYLKDQPLNISIFGFEKLRRQIADTAKLCEISTEQEYNHLLIDDLTYSVFWKTRLPYFAPDLANYWSSRIPDLRLFLMERGSPGAITACRSLPKILRDNARENGSLCCIPDFKSLRHQFRPRGWLDP